MRVAERFRTSRMFWVAALLLGSVPLCAAPDGGFDGRVREIFRARCLKCHGDDEQKSDLNLQQYATAMKGGSGGVSIIPGKPNSSLLFQSIIHAEGVEKMPPKSDKIPAEEIEIIRAWIANGAPEREGGSLRVMDKPRQPSSRVAASAGAVMPQGLKPVSFPERSHPVTGLALSPHAPLLAVAGRGAVHLGERDRGRWLGQLPFHEGIPFVVRFIADGSRLMVAGGSPVRSGRVVIFDVADGARIAEVGDETDAVMAADVSPDGRLVALGGSSRTVKVYECSTGKELYRLRKHTDWITSVAFSPDGGLLATGDRSGGLHLWEAQTGATALSLSEHKDAIHALEWRDDGRWLASGSEDGSVIVWDAKDGWPVVTVSGGHAVGQGKRERNGVLAVAWLADGTFSTVGRDRRVRFWGSRGEALAVSEMLDALPIKLSASGARVYVGDDLGRISWATVDGKQVRVERLDLQ